MRLAQERADDSVRAARLIDDGAAIVVEVLTKAFNTLGQRTLAQIGPAT
jgi:hypothetical protein